MSARKIKFGDKEVDKKKFYSSKQAISLYSVDLTKIVVSKKWKINDTTYKYLCGYLNNDTIQPLCVILPQMNGYIKYFVCVKILQTANCMINYLFRIFDYN